MKIALCGCCGTIGKQCMECLSSCHQVIGLDKKGLCLNHVIQDVDLVIDFTNCCCGFMHGVIALTHQVPIIIGSNGLQETQKSTLQKIANEKQIGCLVVQNFSIGMLWIKKYLPSLTSSFSCVQLTVKEDESHHTCVQSTKDALQNCLNLSTEQVTVLDGKGEHACYTITLENEDEILTLIHEVRNANAYAKQLQTWIKQIQKLNGYLEI